MHESLILLIAIAVLAVPVLAITAMVMAVKAGNRCEDLTRRLDGLAREVRSLRTGQVGEVPVAGAPGAGLAGSEDEKRGDGDSRGGAREAAGPEAAGYGERAPAASPRTVVSAADRRREFSFSFLEEAPPYDSSEPSPLGRFLWRWGLYPPGAEEGWGRLACWWAVRLGVAAVALVGFLLVLSFFESTGARVLVLAVLSGLSAAGWLYVRDHPKWVEGRPVRPGEGGPGAGATRKRARNAGSRKAGAKKRAKNKRRKR